MVVSYKTAYTILLIIKLFFFTNAGGTVKKLSFRNFLFAFMHKKNKANIVS